MKIDFYKLVELLLPTFLRRPRIIALLRVLIAKPLQGLFSAFHLWRLKSRYEGSVSPQVISLIHAIERIFDCVAEITELNGKPYDFLVSIDRSADLNAIREFIDNHKLAGKSYVFRLGDAAFSVTWLSHVRERLVTEYSATWIDFVDSEVLPCNVNLFYAPGNDSSLPYTRGMAIEITTTEMVRSTLLFTIDIDTTENGVTTRVTEILTLNMGETWIGRNTDERVRLINDNTIVGMSVSPQQDMHYYYDPIDISM